MHVATKTSPANKRVGVVMETICPAHIPANSESTKSKSKSKIPDYAKDFRKEWLCIRGINMEFKFLFLDLVIDLCLL